VLQCRKVSATKILRLGKEHREKMRKRMKEKRERERERGETFYVI